MKKILLILGLLLLPQFALAQTPIAAMTVATCGSQNLKAGFTYGLTQDLTGTLCTAGGGSGGTSYTVNYGSAIGVKGTPGGFQDSSGNFQPFLGDTTNGLWVNIKAGGTGGGAVYGPTAVGSAAANPPVLSGGTADGTATGTVAVNVIKAGNTAATTDKAVIVADPNVLAAVNSPIPAGTNLIGKVGIDQTTPGTTNNVAVSFGSAALVDDPCKTVAPTSTPISVTTATTTRIVVPASSKKTYVCYLMLTSAAADNVAIVEGTGGTCGTGTTGVIGGSTSTNGLNFAANGGVAMGNGNSWIAATAGTNVDLCLITSAATPLAGVIKWVQK